MRYMLSCISIMHVFLDCNSPHDYDVGEMVVEESVVVGEVVNDDDVC